MPSAELPPSRSQRAAVAGLGLTVLVFGAAVAAATLRLREGLKEQILRREAATLAAVASMQLDSGAAEYGTTAVGEVPGALLVAVLKAARLRGVAAVRVLDARGQVNSADGLVGGLPPPAPSDWRRVSGGEAFARILDGGAPEEILTTDPESGLLEAWVPLHRGGSDVQAGAAQFWLSAAPVRAELAAHDDRLWLQAAIAWAAGSCVIVVGVAWAFRRLAAANRQLAARTADLERANRELVLSAKTSALGAVAAHLVHELKHPIAGLEEIVAAQGSAGGGDGGAELQAASELTRRLRSMVNDAVGVMRDEHAGASFELTCGELVEVVSSRVRPQLEKAGVRLDAAGAPDVRVDGRRANLAMLVLKNLIQNAAEAAPRGGVIRLRGAAGADDSLEFQVEDEGPGLPEPVRARLFEPCVSTKPGGSGIGLALSHRIALQAGGRLELVRSAPGGTCFRLVLEKEP
jgi:signal transduction histidine kinase